ncbi:MAG: DUF6382 domain-containing protein, partial [Lachnospiraceae bacterium]
AALEQSTKKCYDVVKLIRIYPTGYRSLLTLRLVQKSGAGQVEIKRDLNHNHLMIRPDWEVETDAYPVRMLHANTITCLLPCRMQATNGELFFYYDITALQSVAAYYGSRKMKREDMEPLIAGFLKILKSIEAYLLSPNELLLAPEYLYLEPETRSLHICFLPGYCRDICEQFKELAEYLLPVIDYEDKEAVTLGYELYRISMEKNFTIDKIKESIYQESPGTAGKRFPEEEQQEALQEQIRQEAMRSFFDDDIQPQTSKNYKTGILCMLIGAGGILAACALKAAGYLSWMTLPVLLALCACAITLLLLLARREAQGEPGHDMAKRQSPGAEAAVHTEAYSTAVKEPEESKPHTKQSQAAQTVYLSELVGTVGDCLVNTKPGSLPDIVLEQDLLVIGKVPNAADILLESAAISRIHAMIKRVGKAYYLSDLNSRNGTYVNGIRLNPEQRHLLQEGDEVRLAELVYLFREKKESAAV